MNLSEPFIRRPAMTILVMASLLFFGIISYKNLPVSDLPNVDYPTIQVSVSNPGANPKTMAATVTTPLEREFMTIDGILSITSESLLGSSTITLQFVLDKSMDSASVDVQAAISRAQPLLPPDLPFNPTYKKVNPSAAPIFYLMITSPTISLADLYDYGNTYIGERLSMIEGVSQVRVYGAPYAARIQVNPEKLAAMGIGLDQVSEAIRQGNVNIPTGSLHGNTEEFTINVDGQILKAFGYGELSIKSKEGSLVKISQVGRALDSLRDDKYTLRYLAPNIDQNALVIAIQKQSNANTIEVIREIKKEFPSLKEKLPSSIFFYPVFDRSIYVKDAVFDVQLTLGIAFILVLIAIFFFLGGVVNTLIPFVVLPLSIIGTFSILYLFHFNIDVLSLLALTLSVGFLVDDAIVVLENNIRHVHMGETPFDAAIRGSKEISVTILSMTLCIACVFIPMLFMGGIIGKLFFEFSVTIIAAVILSGFISLSLTPFLSSRFVPPKQIEEKKTALEKFSEKNDAKLLALYRKALYWVLEHKMFTLSIGAFCILASIYLAILLPKTFLPEDDMSFLYGYTQADDKTSPFLMAQYQQKIAKLILEDPAVSFLVSLSSTDNYNEGMLFVALKSFQERGFIQKVIQRLLEKTSQVPGVNTFFSNPPLIDLKTGAASKGLYQYSLFGLDSDALNHYALLMKEKMQALSEITQVSSDVQIRQPQLNLSIRRDRASSLQVDVQKIEELLSFAYSGRKVSTIQTPINQYDVILEVLPTYYKNPEDLLKLYVRSNKGNMVPLKELVDIQQSIGALSINHLDGFPSATISFNLKEAALGDAVKSIEHLASEVLPAGITGKVQGAADVFKTSFASLPFLFLLTIFSIYVVLGILYESFIHPLSVMSALIPASFGALFTLFIFREAISLYSFVGIILVMGIVMKNGIMIVDFASEKVQKGEDRFESIVYACTVRFRPILMTTVCALLGALPIALGVGGLGAQAKRPLGLAVVGGLLFSQVLTLFLTPVIYLAIERVKETFSRAFSTK